MKAWIVAIRPKTLPVGIAPILVGWSIAFSTSANTVDHNIGLLCLITAILLQILSNLANDYFDFKKGADTQERLGPPRAMQSGLLPPTNMKIALFTVGTLAAGVGATLVWHGGPLYIGIGIFALISAVAYTGGPFPLGYHGLGDIFVFLFFGLAAVVGTTHLTAGVIPVATWPAACAMGFLAVNLLVVNNVRDEREDCKNGKKTVVARWGKNFGVGQYALGLVFSYGCIGAVARLTGNNWTIVVAAIAPIGITNLKRLILHQGTPLNDVLAQTALFTFLFGLLLSLALLLG